MERSRFNPKRRLREPRLTQEERDQLRALVKYSGSPLHKRDPGDFGLTPPASPRPDKTLCDSAGILTRAKAMRLLESGIERGLVSQQTGAGDAFPQNVWAVSDDGVPFEAQLENPAQGTYHGYPLPSTDPLSSQVLDWWGADDE